MMGVKPSWDAIKCNKIFLSSPSISAGLNGKGISLMKAKTAKAIQRVLTRVLCWIRPVVVAAGRESSRRTVWRGKLVQAAADSCHLKACDSTGSRALGPATVNSTGNVGARRWKGGPQILALVWCWVFGRKCPVKMSPVGKQGSVFPSYLLPGRGSFFLLLSASGPVLRKQR